MHACEACKHACTMSLMSRTQSAKQHSEVDACAHKRDPSMHLGLAVMADHPGLVVAVVHCGLHDRYLPARSLRMSGAGACEHAWGLSPHVHATAHNGTTRGRWHARLMFLCPPQQLAGLPRKHGPQDEVYTAIWLMRCQRRWAIAAVCETCAARCTPSMMTSSCLFYVAAPRMHAHTSHRCSVFCRTRPHLRVL
jgi:hypothetical protein